MDLPIECISPKCSHLADSFLPIFILCVFGCPEGLELFVKFDFGELASWAVTLWSFLFFGWDNQLDCVDLLCDGVVGHGQTMRHELRSCN